jgi:hypothetical protein
MNVYILLVYFKKETSVIYYTFLYKFYKKVLTVHICSFFYYSLPYILALKLSNSEIYEDIVKNVV